MKLGVCVPYRNREAHLKEFIPKIGKYLDGQGIDYCIYFGHQVDDKLFNRGATKNIAAEWAFKEGCDYIRMIIGIGVWRMMIYFGGACSKVTQTQMLWIIRVSPNRFSLSMEKILM